MVCRWGGVSRERAMSGAGMEGGRGRVVQDGGGGLRGDSTTYVQGLRPSIGHRLYCWAGLQQH